MLVFWIAVFAVCEVIGCILHIYQTIMQTYYTKEAQKKEKERDERDKALAASTIKMQSEYKQYTESLLGIEKNIDKKYQDLKEMRNESDTVY